MATELDAYPNIKVVILNANLQQLRDTSKVLVNLGELRCAMLSLVETAAARRNMLAVIDNILQKLDGSIYALTREELLFKLEEIRWLLPFKPT